ncbi:hypothetical protein B0H10DRAFT_1960750 [Mycena sp. CBHHK59/15]|nr:hypothetical protein B0H10DRAFT_1960750 [Mycena sp. CBHHK59/15]
MKYTHLFLSCPLLPVFPRSCYGELEREVSELDILKQKVRETQAVDEERGWKRVVEGPEMVFASFFDVMSATNSANFFACDMSTQPEVSVLHRPGPNSKRCFLALNISACCTTAAEDYPVEEVAIKVAHNGQNIKSHKREDLVELQAKPKTEDIECRHAISVLQLEFISRPREGTIVGSFVTPFSCQKLNHQYLLGELHPPIIGALNS